ncbi:MAG: PIN domain-containing protein [Bacteroidota bacterium]
MVQSGFGVLTIESTHLDELAKLPLHHRDPFDRLLIAQCRAEGFTFLT